MAAAISFNVLVALVPLLVLAAGLTGFLLSARFEDPTAAVVSLLVSRMPEAGLDLTGLVRGLVDGMVARRTGFTVVGLVFFVLLATRLAGTLRSALREIFDVADRRGILAGKAFDVGVVLVGVVLLTLNLGATVVYPPVVAFGLRTLHLEGAEASFTERAAGALVAFGSIWLLFLLAYRYLPARRIRWRPAVIAASFAAVGHELLKGGFSWYATEVADYGSAFGNLATVALLIFWIYYGSLVFILGGEFAQVSTMRKASRVAVARFRTGS